MANYGEIDVKMLDMTSVVECELDLGIEMVDDTVARIPYASVKIPYASLKLNAKDARVLMAL
jgi:hypothetical protein